MNMPKRLVVLRRSRNEHARPGELPPVSEQEDRDLPSPAEENVVTVLATTPMVARAVTPVFEQYRIEIALDHDSVGTVDALIVSHWDAAPDDLSGVPESMQAVLRSVLHPDGGAKDAFAEMVEATDAWGLVLGEVDLDCPLAPWHKALVRIIQGLGKGCAWAAILADQGTTSSENAPGGFADYLGIGFQPVGDGVVAMPLATLDLENTAAVVHGRADADSLRLPTDGPQLSALPANDGDAGVMSNLTITADDIVEDLRLHLGLRLWLAESVANAGMHAGRAGTRGKELREYSRELLWLLSTESPDRMGIRRIQAFLRTVEQDVLPHVEVPPATVEKWREVVDEIDDLLAWDEDDSGD